MVIKVAELKDSKGGPVHPGTKAECIDWFSIFNVGNSLPLTPCCDTGPGGSGLPVFHMDGNRNDAQQ